MAGLVQVPTSAVRIVAGLTGARKLVEIEGTSPERLDRAMLDFHGHRKNSGSAPASES